MIEISFSYKSLFKLEIRHNFYAEKVTSDLELVPTAESMKLSRRLGMVLRKGDNDYSLLYEPDKMEGLYDALKNNQDLKFSYLLYSNNPHFINFTEVPVEINSGIFYFTNNIVKQSAETFYLHTSDYAGKDNRFSLKRDLQVSGGGKQKLIELKDDAGKVAFSRNIGPEETLQISNNIVPLGQYHLYENGVHQDAIVLLSNVPIPRPLGVVEISLSGIIREELMEGIEDNNIPLYNYKIAFSERHTFWKYFLVSKYQANLKNTIIESGGSKLKFHGPEEVKLSNGRDAVMFVSDQPLPILQVNDLRFQLKNVRTGISGGKIVMDKLPLASPEMIRPESREENSKIYSEIIVYI